MLLLYPGNGGLVRALGASDGLVEAGLSNNSTVEVRYRVLGGAGPEEGKSLVSQRGNGVLTLSLSRSVYLVYLPLPGVREVVQKPQGT